MYYRKYCRQLDRLRTVHRKAEVRRHSGSHRQQKDLRRDDKNSSALSELGWSDLPGARRDEGLRGDPPKLDAEHENLSDNATGEEESVEDAMFLKNSSICCTIIIKKRTHFEMTSRLFIR